MRFPARTPLSPGSLRIFRSAAALLLVALPAFAGEAVSVKDAAWLRRAGVREVRKTAPDAPILVFSPDDQLRFLGPDDAAPGNVRLTQVVPIPGGITKGHFDDWVRNLPPSLRAAESFRFDNGSILGEGEYGAVRVTTVDRSAPWPHDPSLLIDADFFIPLYLDEVRTPMIPLVMKIYAALRRGGVRPRSVTIVSRTGEMMFPLDFGYLPALLREVFLAPESFRDDLPRKWKRVEEAQFLAFFGQREEALGKIETDLRPGEEPYAHYIAAVLRFQGEDFEGGVKELGEAAADPEYRRGYLVQAGALWRGGELGAAERILRAGVSRFPSEMVLNAGLARLLFEQAVAVREEDAGKARTLVEEALSLPVPPEVREEIRAAWSSEVAKPPH